ncbi:MAG: adenylyl-sulfate kinase [Patescibacteria group bacterium]
MARRFPIIWLTGNTGAGKTTLARAAETFCNEVCAEDSPAARRCIVLDGDEMRSTISLGATLSPEDRRTHNLRVARLANLLSERGFLVVVSVIAPFASVRKEIDALCRPLWVYVKRSGLEAVDRPYEVPAYPTLTINNDMHSKDEALGLFLQFLRGIVAGSGLKSRGRRQSLSSHRA